MSPAKRRVFYARAKELAIQRATTFRLARRVKSGPRKGELLTGFELIVADTERNKQNAVARGARPVLKSSEWRAIKAEVAAGL